MWKFIAERKVLITLLITVLLVLAMINSATWLVKIVYPVYHKDIIFKYANQYGIDPYLVTAIIRVESKFYHKAQSHKGARGLMQISPITGRWAAQELEIQDYSTQKLFDPETNIMIGCWYLSILEKEFKGNFRTVIAAYNGGSGNVNRWLQDPRYSKDGENLHYIPYKETREYVEKVLRDYRIYKMLYN